MTQPPATELLTLTGSVSADLHVLQAIPPSNLNRDEDQEPKTIQKLIPGELTRRTRTIALFGRMLAGVPVGHVGGTVQFAPPFTVHEFHHQPDRVALRRQDGFYLTTPKEDHL